MRKALGLMVGLLAGCGGGAEHVPCTGQGCIDVAGNYTVTAQSPGSGNTCKHIFYVLGSDGTAEESFEAPFTLTQSGADLTFSFLGSGVAFEVQGTLFADHSASFTQQLPHITVSGGDGTFDYADNTSVSLTFSPGSDGVLRVAGSMHDTLSANGTPVPDDALCALQASLTGQR